MFIAGAGWAAALPGVVAAQTPLPVLGVPLETRVMGGMDSLLSMAQMPGGIPVGTLAIGKAGAKNAALLAAAILALSDEGVAGRLDAFRKKQNEAIAEVPANRLLSMSSMERRRSLKASNNSISMPAFLPSSVATMYLTNSIKSRV